MAFKHNSPGGCLSCDEPVVCPERPGVNMYLFHEIDSDPGVLYVSKVLGTRYYWTVECPVQSAFSVVGVDGGRTLWFSRGSGNSSTSYELEVWWITSSGGTGYWDLEVEWNLGDFSNGTATNTRAAAFGVTGGSGLYFLVEEFYELLAGAVNNDELFNKHYGGHATTSAAGTSLITQTDHLVEGGEIVGLEEIYSEAMIGCQSNLLYIVRRRRAVSESEPNGIASLQVWWGGTLATNFVGGGFAFNNAFSSASHFHGDHALAALLLLDDPITPTGYIGYVYLFDSGSIDGSGIYPATDSDTYYHSVPPEGRLNRGVMIASFANDTSQGFFDVDGDVQVLTVDTASDYAAGADHLNRDFYSQSPDNSLGTNGWPEFTETNLVTSSPASGEIEWDAAYIPTAGVFINWVDYYQFANSTIHHLLPIADFS